MLFIKLLYNVVKFYKSYVMYVQMLCIIITFDLLKMYATFWGGVEEACTSSERSKRPALNSTALAAFFDPINVNHQLFYNNKWLVSQIC